jgi:hypothetical protein
MAKHQPYKDTPKQGPQRPLVVSPAEAQATLRFGTAAYLNRHVGGTWRWDDDAHAFTANFDARVAHAIQLFFQPKGIELEGQPTGEDQTRLRVTPEDYAHMLAHVSFGPREQALASQYATMIGLSRLHHRR